VTLAHDEKSGWFGLDQTPAKKYGGLPFVCLIDKSKGAFYLGWFVVSFRRDVWIFIMNRSRQGAESSRKSHADR
jgi:hypothetical protein